VVKQVICDNEEEVATRRADDAAQPVEPGEVLRPRPKSVNPNGHEDRAQNEQHEGQATLAPEPILEINRHE
jgi:hypothetical protein